MTLKRDPEESNWDRLFNTTPIGMFVLNEEKAESANRAKL